MRQLLLNWGVAKPQTLDTFVIGHNQEVAQLLQMVSTRSAHALNERFIYLWGAAGSGKSHLLHALHTASHARYIDAVADGNAFLFDANVSLYLVDDCDKLSAENQINLFNLFNQIREHNGVLVTTGAVAPAILNVREDLRTRLGWGLIYQVHELTDAEKIDALTQSASARGLSLSPGVLPYLITHFRRDMRSLSALLDALDHYSLETKRPITLPLLRELLQLDGIPNEPT